MQYTRLTFTQRQHATSAALIASLCAQASCRGSDGTHVWRGPYRDVSAQGTGSCAVRSDGQIACWGSSDPIWKSMPPGQALRSVVTASCGYALREDGTLSVWGNPSCRTPPSGAFRVLSSGGVRVCASGELGVLCWEPEKGQSSPELRPGAYSDLSVGKSHTCAVTQNGTLQCWRTCGMRLDGQIANCPAKRAPPPGQFTKVASGNDVSCALSTSGEIACWGDNSRPDPDAQIVSPPKGAGYTQLSMATWAACALDARAEVVCWGAPLRWGPTTIRAPSGPFRQVAVGGTHACALRYDGNVVCWGRDQQGQVSGKPPFPRT
jgi:alpha-tubulin suppressor-like RCC1 family protein